MVLQQGTEVPIWGWSDTFGEKVTIEYRDFRVSTVVKDRKWMVKLPKMPSGGPATMRIYSETSGVEPQHTTLVLLDVVVGEVWVASGQSNMEMALRGSQGASNDIAAAGNQDIRLPSRS